MNYELARFIENLAFNKKIIGFKETLCIFDFDNKRYAFLDKENGIYRVILIK